MTRSITLLACASLVAASLGVHAFAQGTPQNFTLTGVNTTTLVTGYRTSKVVGAKVVNEANETVGEVDDLIVTPTDKVPFAVLAVGGFLGMGERNVVVPASSLEIGNKTVMLRGATKESLKALPEYKYTY